MSERVSAMLTLTLMTLTTKLKISFSLVIVVSAFAQSFEHQTIHKYLCGIHIYVYI